MTQLVALPAKSASGEAALWAIRFLCGREPRDMAEIDALRRLGQVSRIRAVLMRGPRPARFTFEAPMDAWTVTWAFRMILGRPPESAAVVAQFRALPSPQALADTLYDSAEFESNGKPWTQIEINGHPALFTGQPSDGYYRGLHLAADDAGQVGDLAAAVGRARGRPMEIVDIGANLGLTAVAMAPHASRLLAVEPNPITADCLGFNLGLNSLDHVELARTALGDTEGEVSFHTAEFAAGSHIAEDDGVRPSTRVPITLLDSLLAERGFGDVGFIKIDVEGFERQVIGGATATLASSRPVIFVEFNTWALMANGDNHPLRLLAEWVAAFPHVHAMTEVTALRFNPIGPRDIRDILYRNIFHRGCVENLVLSHDLGWLEQLP
jgi:FkbM family methyltransferase